MKKIFLLLTLFMFINCGLRVFAAGPHNFWVTAGYFGANNYGAILKSDSTGHQFSQVASFNYVNGWYPAGDVVLVGNGKIYGICEHGGVGNSCTLYSFDTTTNVITKLHDFSLSLLDGDIPMSGLILGDDCKLYGTTAEGGANNGGVIFSFDPATNIYNDIYDFVDSTGKEPFAQITLLADGKIYGTAQHGGHNGLGAIFGYDPMTHIYTDLYDFVDTTGGVSWYCKLIQAPDGNLYGTTPLGGILHKGVLFRFSPLTHNYEVLYNFNTGDGSPYGKVAYVNSKLYGVTRGTSGGIIFSYDLSADTFHVEMNFNGTNGANPRRGLNLSSNGTLFGTTYDGGIYNFGVIFSYDPSTGTYEKILDFDSTSTGAHPDCDVIETGIYPNLCIPESTTEKNNLSDFSIFPNPVGDETTISGLYPFGKIEIYNLLGEKIYSSLIRENKEVINCKNFSRGLYFVKVSNGEKIFTQKLMKE